jgi:hypothetical protein
LHPHGTRGPRGFVGDEVEIREDRDPQISKIFVPKPAMTSAGTQIAPVLPNKIAAGAGD